MSRGRAWRRHHNQRVIRKRMKIAKRNWYNLQPGRYRKWNFTCGCGMCHWIDGDHDKINECKSPKVSDYF